MMGCCALAGCASQARTTPAAPSANVNSAGSGTVTTASASPGAATTVSATEKPIPYGYTRVEVNGVEKFCRVDTYTGSRTEKQRVCLTRRQLDDLQNTSTTFIQDVQRRAGTSTMNGIPGNGGSLSQMGGH